MRKTIMIVAAALSAGVFAMPEGFTDDWDAALKKAESERSSALHWQRLVHLVQAP